jgi:hypothetical protein
MPIINNPGLRSKLKAGLAHIVSCYAHSGEQWGLIGEVHQCQWDTVRIAGLLVWTGKPSELGRKATVEQRTQMARNWLHLYSNDLLDEAAY